MTSWLRACAIACWAFFPRKFVFCPEPTHSLAFWTPARLNDKALNFVYLARNVEQDCQNKAKKDFYANHKARLRDDPGFIKGMVPRIVAESDLRPKGSRERIVFRGSTMYEGEIRICELWLDHPTLYGIRSAKLVATFGDDGMECWNACVWKVSFPKKDLDQQMTEPAR